MDNTIIKNVYFLKIFKLEAIDFIECADGSISTETMLIGFFDSVENCEKVENDYKKLPGFSLPSCKFVKTQYVFSSTKRFSIGQVFYVQKCTICELTGDEKTTEIGLYLSKNAANAAKEQYARERNANIPLESQEKNDTIYVDEYRINQRHWSEGFTRYTWIPE